MSFFTPDGFMSKLYPILTTALVFSFVFTVTKLFLTKVAVVIGQLVTGSVVPKL
jgi:hypothetical protein